MNPASPKNSHVAKLLPKTSKPTSIPGTVEYFGRKRKSPVKIHVIDYNRTKFTERNLKSVSEILPFKRSSTVTWINFIGVHDENIIHEVGKIFEIHPLVLEDIANTTQRPKIEEHESSLFIIIKMAYLDNKTQEVLSEQVSLLVGRNYVISFQEKEDNVLEGLRENIRRGRGRIRHAGSDYLMYGIIDTIIDNYYSILEKFGGEIEILEEKLLRSANQELLNKIYKVKQELIFLRKAIWPMRELVSTLQHSEHRLIKRDTAIYLRDVYDHALQMVEAVETLRDMTSGMLELYLTTVSNKMNEVMKVLTIFAAIFIPLTFLTGVYGMNFEFMPELASPIAYPLWWVITITLAVSMIIYFKKKKWI